MAVRKKGDFWNHKVNHSSWIYITQLRYSEHSSIKN